MAEMQKCWDVYECTYACACVNVFGFALWLFLRRLPRVVFSIGVRCGIGGRQVSNSVGTNADLKTRVCVCVMCVYVCTYTHKPVSFKCAQAICHLPASLPIQEPTRHANV